MTNEESAIVRLKMMSDLFDDLRGGCNCAAIHMDVLDQKALYTAIKSLKGNTAEWLPDDELSFDPARPWWKCSHCYERTGIRTKYCSDCGYKMRCQADG